MNDLDIDSSEKKNVSNVQNTKAFDNSQMNFFVNPSEINNLIGQEQLLNQNISDRLSPVANPFRQRSSSQLTPKTSPKHSAVNRSKSEVSSPKGSAKSSPNRRSSPSNRSPLRMSPKRRSSQGSPKRSPSRLSPNLSPSLFLRNDSPLHEPISEHYAYDLTSGTTSTNIPTPEGFEVKYLPVLVPKSNIVPLSPSDKPNLVSQVSDCDEKYNRETIRYQRERLDTLINEMSYLEKSIKELTGKNKRTKDSINKLIEGNKMSGFSRDKKISEENKKKHLDCCIIKASEQKLYYENILLGRQNDDTLSKLSTLQISGNWTCESCTLENDELSDQCVACLQPNYNKSQR